MDLNKLRWVLAELRAALNSGSSVQQGKIRSSEDFKLKMDRTKWALSLVKKGEDNNVIWAANRFRK